MLLQALELIADAENSALDLAYCKGVARAAIAEAKGQQDHSPGTPEEGYEVDAAGTFTG